MRHRLALRLATLLAVLAIATALALPDASAQTPKKGGALRVGMIGEPPSLDPHTTTATITREIGINMFETLYTLDAKFQPVPLLADGHDALDGAKRYVIRLRKGVRFHNGKELTADDVVASLQRWGKVA
ncbi:MAG: ABC transporter substrate-binding protein, partial [Candidatus Rokubacteria bacterium]|nr:ABC transporter substrate-binding protein [Candidatus Rokubacteria bacterium]